MPPHPLANFEIQNFWQINKPKLKGVYSQNTKNQKLSRVMMLR